MRKLLLSLGIALVSFTSSQAQTDFTLHFMPHLYQSSKTNPAFRPNNNFSFQFVNLYFSLSNSVSYNDLFKDNDIEAAINRLEAKNYLAFGFSSDIFSFRFKVKSMDFNFNFSENIDLGVGYPKDVFVFAREGNAQTLLGKRASFDGLGVNFNAYHELGFGTSYKWNNLTLGAKVKYLIGTANVSTSKSNLGIYTSQLGDTITIDADLLVNTAGIPSADTSYKYDAIDNLTKPGNRGWGLDLGASYDINKKFTINASVINLISFINWKNYVTNYSGGKTFTYTGLKVNRINDFVGNGTNGSDNFKDTILKDLTSQTHTPYRSYLIPRWYLSGIYNINEKNKLGFLFTAQYFEKIRPGYTFSFDKQIGRIWNVCFTYSIYNRSYNNVGFGTSLRLAAMETYIITDNIMTAFKPFDVNNVNLRFGINWVFGRPKKNKPKEPEFFAQRTDRDGDFIDDKNDKCPDEPGLFKFQGCPDTDGDGVADDKDSCLTIPGLEKFNGCPDTDNDGVLDYKDECPGIPGLAAFNGCPDSDGDSIPDYKDACPTLAGSKKTGGCPDKDGDGIIDSNDECPDRAGSVLFKGCPDTDNDSVPDNLDKCPETPGPKENNGCPKVEEPVKAELSAEEQEIVNKVFSNLEFEAGKSVIKESSNSALDQLTELLTKKPNFKLQISGYTDNVGKEAINKKLSKARANAVKAYITNKGISADRIISEGFGSSKPIAPNTTEEGRAKNRRVEFTILE